MKVQDLIPVLLSMTVIALVAVLEKQSKLFSALTATMPLNAPLALWIVYSANAGEKSAMTQFSSSLILGLIPSLAFLIVVWLAARAGMKFLPMILTGYSVWALGATLLYLFRNMIGLK